MQAPNNLKPDFASFMQQHTGFVPESIQEKQSLQRELQFLKSMFEGQAWNFCEKCGRPLVVKRQFKRTEMKPNPNYVEVVPFGAQAQEKEIEVAKPTFGVYSFQCSGKDPGAGKDVEAAHHFVYRPFLDHQIMAFYDQLSEPMQRLMANQKKNPAEPLLTFTEEDFASYNRGEWTYLNQQSADLVKASLS